jgi:hypothetical protein
MRILHKKLSIKEALEYIAMAAWYKDVPEEFDGEITCEMNDDGSVDLYASSMTKEEKEAPMN